MVTTTGAAGEQRATTAGLTPAKPDAQQPLEPHWAGAPDAVDGAVDVDGPVAGVEGSAPSRAERHSPARTIVGTYLALWAVLSALTVGAGFALTKLIVADGRGDWDAAISRWLADRRTGWIDDATGAATAIANTMPVLGLTAVTCLILLVLRKWPQALFVASALLFEVTVFLTANTLVERARPDVPRMDSTPATGSYPSGHAGASFAFWVGLAVVVVWLIPARTVARRVAVWTFVVLAAAVALSVAFARVYRGMHFTTDVVAGILVGTGALVAAAIAVRVTTRAVATARSDR